MFEALPKELQDNQLKAEAKQITIQGIVWWHNPIEQILSSKAQPSKNGTVMSLNKKLRWNIKAFSSRKG